MYVCICARVRESELRDVIRCGAITEEAVGEACGAGTGCGSCLDRICDVIDEVVREEVIKEVPAGADTFATIAV